MAATTSPNDDHHTYRSPDRFGPAATAIDIIVSISDNEPDAKAELEDLARNVADAGSVTEQRQFDGATTLQIFIGLTAATFPYFRTWMRARSEQRKVTKFMYKGVEIEGFTSKEVESIIDRINKSEAFGGPHGED